jgi:hypothetical protein
VSLSSWQAWNWIIGFLGYILLMTVLVVRKRYRTFPWFTFLLAQEIAQTIVLFTVHRSCSARTYSYTYWSFEILEAAVRVGVLFELARITARLLRENASERLRALMNAIVIAAAICGGVVIGMHVSGTLMVVTAVKISLCTSILSGLLVFSFVLTTFFEGVRSRIHSQALAYGMFFYFSGKLAAEMGLLFGGTHLWFRLQSYTQPLYIVCLFAWSAILWHDEPKRILTEEMHRLRQSFVEMELRRQGQPGPLQVANFTAPPSHASLAGSVVQRDVFRMAFHSKEN